MEHLVPGHQLKQLVSEWLKEDTPSFDPAGAILHGRKVEGTLLCKAEGILCGRPFVQAIFEELSCNIEWYFNDGDKVENKTVVAKIIGEAQNVLLGERVALNLIARASGIATKCHKVSQKMKEAGFNGRIAGTRKTTPGFRLVEKYALIVGGCDPHRYDLSSMIMLKDNHVDIAGSITAAIRLVWPLKSFSQKIEVECRSLEDAMEALQAGADVAMLDNAGPEKAGQWALEIKKLYPHAIVEVSGGINESNVLQYNQPGIDVISMGSLTQDQQHIDFSLKIK